MERQLLSAACVLICLPELGRTSEIFHTVLEPRCFRERLREFYGNRILVCDVPNLILGDPKMLQGAFHFWLRVAALLY
jgi:hypothetical protein